MSGHDEETGEETRVLYNAECPICSREIDHYRGRAQRNGLPIRFDALQGPGLADWGVDADAAARRLHVRHQGRVVSGMEAFRLLWRQMPQIAWLARVTGAPGLRQGSDWLYDRVAAPLLYRMHRRRVARRAR
ncbi:thiol-disulfide oxidoreductase DCC family protein [Jannaschia formosa]|uniref:thiol-disulfide oxidoreductase DCC family protein n=1 Tax=Jannaschia formosa TaxID=2259592 RepID=UPI000E1C053E|nr:DUF393 domain-containing protein [Jannaschia formosa]TFL19121.1 DUF393 domain-containing protein [Jannaschia formosa]